MERTWKIILGVIITVTLLLFGATVYAATAFLSTSDADNSYTKLELIPLDKAPPPLNEEKVVEVPEVVYEEVLESPKGRIFVLALGLDSRGDHLRGRSDAIVVISMDKEKDQIDMVSIPRDSYVEIGSTGKFDKIAHAYSHGGIEVTKETVERLFGINIDYYGVFNFSSFVSLVDTLGGLEIDVPFTFTEQDSKDRQGAIRVEKGLQVLDGEKSLAYARMRKQDPRGDIGRGERQQEVVKVLFDELISFSSLTKLGEIRNSLKGSLLTNVDLLDLPKLSPYINAFKTVNSNLLEGKGKYINGIYYYELSTESVSKVREIFE